MRFDLNIFQFNVFFTNIYWEISHQNSGKITHFQLKTCQLKLWLAFYRYAIMDLKAQLL